MSQPSPFESKLRGSSAIAPTAGPSNESQLAAILLAIGSWCASLSILVLGPSLVVLHLLLLHLRLKYWWISFVAILSLSLWALIAAHRAAPRDQPGTRRGGAVACMFLGRILFGLASCTMLICSFMMWAILSSDVAELAHFTSGAPANEPQLGAHQRQQLVAKKAEIAALRRDVEEQQDELQKAHDARALARQAASAAAQKRAEEARRQEFEAAVAARRARKRTLPATTTDKTRPDRRERVPPNAAD